MTRVLGVRVLSGKLKLAGMLSLAFLWGEVQAREEIEDVPAEIRVRIPPAYPAVCEPAIGSENLKNRVTVNFSVSEKGQTENVRVVEATDDCFNEAAVTAVRQWSYKPRRVHGLPRGQEDLEVVITFVWQEAVDLTDVDAKPIERIPPEYPSRCTRSATQIERVLIEFDVTKEGAVENARVVESTGRCFERATLEAAKLWRYEPRILDGEPVRRKGVQTTMTFRYSAMPSASSPAYRLSRSVRKKINLAKQILNKEAGDPRDALAIFDEIERDFGDSLSRIEIATFHQLRAAARIQIGDNKGALDDLRIVRQNGMSWEAKDAIDRLIEQLEQAVAYESAMAAQKAASESVPEDVGSAEESDN